MSILKEIHQGLCNGEFAGGYQRNEPECEKRLKNAYSQLGEDSEEVINLIAADFETQGFTRGFKFAVQLMAECMIGQGGDSNG